MTKTVLPPAVFGVAGDTSKQMLDRAAQLSLNDIAAATAVADMAGVYGFPNDRPNALTDSDTQLYCEAIIMSMKFGAYGDGFTQGGTSVAGQSALPATGRIGQRYVVLADTSTTGGASAWSPAQKATVTGTVTGPTVWEFRHQRSGEAGWGRIATRTTTPTHTRRVFAVSTNYKNYTTNGGDTTAAGASTRRDTLSTPEPFYAGTRAAQQAAVAAQNGGTADDPWVVYVDLYTLQKTMVQGGTFKGVTFAAGTVPDFSGGAAWDSTKTWHVADTNQHHNAYGHHLVALATLLTVTQLSGWVTAILAQKAPLNIKILGDSQSDYHPGYCRAFYTWGPTFGRMMQEYLDWLTAA